MKRILITGGAGFIGSTTVDLLLAQGLEVVVYDNLSTGKKANLNLAHPQLTFIENDIANATALTAALTSVDAVLHLAALPSVPKSIEDPVASLQVNLLGFLHVLQAIRASLRPIRLVYASSAAVYGATETLPCADDSTLPESVLSPYALEKANCERYAELYARLFSLPSLGLRYFNVYGARQDPHSPYSGVISRFIERYHDDQEITIFGNGQQARDFIHVQDVARANVLALHSDYAGVLNIATGVPETLTNLVGYITAAGQKPAKINYQPARIGDIDQSYAQVMKAADLIKFRSNIALAKGIEILLKK